MKVKEVLILLSIISSSIASIVRQQCYYHVYALNQAEDVSNVGSNCLCPPQSGYQVSQALNEPNSNVERVVVFYYRDKTNNNIYMFTPNKEKQLTIPELTVEKDDDLYKVSSDFTIRLFEPSTIAVNINAQNPFENPLTQHYPYGKQNKVQSPNIVKIDHPSNAWYDQRNMQNVAGVYYLPDPSSQKLTFDKDDDLYKKNSDFTLRPFETSAIVENIDTPNLFENPTTQHHPNNKLNKVQSPKIVKVDHPSNAWYDQKNMQNVAGVYYLPHPSSQELTSDKSDDQHKKNSDFKLKPFETSTIAENIVAQNRYENLIIQHPYKKRNKVQSPTIVQTDHPLNVWYDHKNVQSVAGVHYLSDASSQELTFNEDDDLYKESSGFTLRPFETSENIDAPNLYQNPTTQHYPYKEPNKVHSPKTIKIDHSYTNVATIDYATDALDEKERDEYGDYSTNDFNDNKKGLYMYDQKKETINDYSNNDNRIKQNETKTDHNDKEDSVSSFIQLSNKQHWSDNGQISNFYDFKSWYSQQTTLIPELISNDLHNFSIDKVKGNIVNLFEKHEYSVTNNQVLNGNGRPVDLNKFKLIRVIIRAPDDERPLSSKVVGVMLVNMSPHTILGVVPLKNTFDETNNQGSDEEINYLEEYVNVTNDFNQGDKNMTVEQESNGILAKTPNKVISVLSNLRNLLGRIVPSSQIFETTRRDSGEEVLPGFRIIGGNPATGSGTPIASKGRSASP